MALDSSYNLKCVSTCHTLSCFSVKIAKHQLFYPIVFFLFKGIVHPKMICYHLLVPNLCEVLSCVSEETHYMFRYDISLLYHIIHKVDIVTGNVSCNKYYFRVGGTNRTSWSITLIPDYMMVFWLGDYVEVLGFFCDEIKELNKVISGFTVKKFSVWWNDCIILQDLWLCSFSMSIVPHIKIIHRSHRGDDTSVGKYKLIWVARCVDGGRKVRWQEHHVSSFGKTKKTNPLIPV